MEFKERKLPKKWNPLKDTPCSADAGFIKALAEDIDKVVVAGMKQAPRLTIELVPRSCWCQNLRHLLKSSDWDKLRHAQYKKAGYKCEICGGVGSKHPVECHEIWEYDDKAKIQKLVGLIALCTRCHQVKHFGLTQLRGYEDAAKRQLERVNKWGPLEVTSHIRDSVDLWMKRSRRKWKLDLSWLKQFGIVPEGTDGASLVDSA